MQPTIDLHENGKLQSWTTIQTTLPLHRLPLLHPIHRVSPVLRPQIQQQCLQPTTPPNCYQLRRNSDLHNFITSTVKELKNAIVSLPTQRNPSTSEMETTPTSSNMETEVEHPTATTPDLLELITGLKNDIATKLDISDLIANLKSDIALIKSHNLFRNL